MTKKMNKMQNFTEFCTQLGTVAASYSVSLELFSI